MVKNVFLMFIGLSIISLSYGQTSTADVVGNSEELKSIPQLKVLAENVNSTYAFFQQSASASRTASAKAKTDYESALMAYLSELELQLAKESNAASAKSIQTEIDLVKRLQANLAPPSTK